MFIEVIPLDGSIDHGALTYFIPNDLAKQTNIGSLVEVPWRNTLSYAIVTKIGSESIPEGVRSVSMLACSLPILTPYQIETILDLARHYFVHAHQILSLFLPKLFVRSMEKKSFAQLVHMKAERNKKMTKPTLLHISGKQDIYAVLNNHIESKKNDGVVVIFPDDFAVEWYLRFSNDGEENKAILLDSLTDTQKYKRWLSVYEWEKKIIIWTRRLLYYNLSHYRHIIYVEDALGRFTMRFQHTYKNTDVLERLWESGHFEITILSTLPSVASMFRVHSKEYDFENV